MKKCQYSPFICHGKRTLRQRRSVASQKERGSFKTYKKHLILKASVD